MQKTLHIHRASQNHLAWSFSLSIFLYVIQELVHDLFDIQICRIDNDGIIGWSKRPDGSVFIAAKSPPSRLTGIEFVEVISGPKNQFVNSVSRAKKYKCLLGGAPQNIGSRKLW